MERFTAAAAAPILLNLILIAALLAVIAFELPGGHALAWGVALAGIAQCAMLYVAARRAGIGLRLRWPRLTPGVKRLIALGIPGVIAGGATQINLVIGGIIASMAEGAISWLYYADRLYQLPLGVIGVAIGVVLLPDIARRLRADDFSGAGASQNRALELSMALTIPAAVALAVIPAVICRALFEHGRFGAEDTAATAMAVAAFAAGLPAFVLIKVFQPGFFAREDTKTPLRYALVGVVVNIVGSLALFPPFGHVGVAVATSLAGWANAWLLGRRLMALGHFSADGRLRQRLPRILAAGLGMGLALHFGARALEPLTAGSTLGELIGLAILVAGGVAVYFGLAQALGALRLGDLKAAMRR